MLFWIIVIALVVLMVAAGMIAYHTSAYNNVDNAGVTAFLTMIIGGLLSFGVLMSVGSHTNENPAAHQTTSEKTYTLAEGSVPVYDSGKLSFSYTEDGKIYPYSEYVDRFEVGMDMPKAFKITEYEVEDLALFSWVIGDGIKVETLK